MRPKLPNEPDPIGALAALPELEGVTFCRILRDAPSWTVCEIWLRGRPAFLKQFRHCQRAETIARTVTRLHEAAALLGQAENAVTLPVLVLPEHGVIVTEAARGRPLANILARAPAARRAALIGRAGLWLAALCHASRERGGFGAMFWIRRLEERVAATEADWIDSGLVASHMQIMRAEARGLRGTEVERAAIHGDLTPDNLFFDTPGNRMTGLDMHGRSVVPVAHDMARLLVWLESRRRRRAPERIDGIAAQDYRALVATPGLMGADQVPILRLMIGLLALEFYLDSGRQPRRRQALVRCLGDWAAVRPGP